MTAKKMIEVSQFKGFSKPVGNTPLTGKLEEIAGGKHLVNVGKLRQYVREGKEEEAARIKRQLPGFTLSATYREIRKEEGLTGYNDLVMLDFDKLPEEKLVRCRELITASAHTLFCFRSPSGNGLKVGVYFRSEEAEHLRGQCFARPEMTITALEEYHKRIFEWCRTYYERLCQAPVDTSGSDIGRLCFVSHDPEIYINYPGIEALTAPQVSIVIPPPAPKKVEKAKVIRKPELIQAELPGDESVDRSHIDPHIQMEFQRCVNSTQRNMTYQPGQRDMYLYALGHRCYCKAIPQEHATVLTQHRYGGAPDIDIPKIIANAYQYTSRTDRQEEGRQKMIGARIMEFLDELYEARRNIVLESLEFRPKTTDGEGIPFRPIRKEDYNTMYLDAQFAGIACQPHIVKAVVNSRFARPFNPFEEYFYNLPPWDMKTDHIGRLTETLQTNNQAFWRDCFRRWIVGMVACALDDDRENQLALIIKGAQGKGKSTWIRRLLPPELRQYYRNGMLNPNNKDHMLFLSQRMLINLEEFEGMKKDDIAELKRLISQDAITERKAYGEEAGYYVRRASFIASTNEPRFLEDITGTRRFPTVTAEEIDYKHLVDHTGVYAQALHLWRGGFRYWYEEEEFRALNANNTQYVIASQEEELFFVYFRKPLPRDYSIKWLPVSLILSHLVIYGKIQPHKQNQRTLIKVLERDNFRKRVSENNIVEYEVALIVES